MIIYKNVEKFSFREDEKYFYYCRIKSEIGIDSWYRNFDTTRQFHNVEFERWKALSQVSVQSSLFLSFCINDTMIFIKCFSFITWKDLRADNLVKEWNSSIIMRILKMGSKILYTFSRNKRFLGMSVFKFMNTQVLSLSRHIIITISNNPFNSIRPVGFKSKDRK